MTEPLPVDAVVAAVREAGAMAVAERTKGLSVDTKARQDFVTQADRAVERLLRAKLTALLPGSEFLGEEDGGEVDGFCEGHLWPWDVLAGLLIAHEAGCFVSEYLEGDAMRNGNAVLVAAPGVEDAIMRAADDALADFLPNLIAPPVRA